MCCVLQKWPRDGLKSANVGWPEGLANKPTKKEYKSSIKGKGSTQTHT